MISVYRKEHNGDVMNMFCDGEISMRFTSKRELEIEGVDGLKEIVTRITIGQKETEQFVEFCKLLPNLKYVRKTEATETKIHGG